MQQFNRSECELFVSLVRLCDRYSGFYGCQNGDVISIVSAFYGRKSSAYCPNGDRSNTNCYVDATRHIRFQAHGKSFGIATASSVYFGDPCPGISKYLEIKYKCKNPGMTCMMDFFKLLIPICQTDEILFSINLSKL